MGLNSTTTNPAATMPSFKSDQRLPNYGVLGRRKLGKWLFVLIAAGIALICYSIVWLWDTYCFAKSAERTDGTIVWVPCPGFDREAVVLGAEFTDHLGRRHEFPSAVPGRRFIGEKVQVLYDRDNPSSAKISTKDELYFHPVMGILVQSVDKFEIG